GIVEEREERLLQEILFEISQSVQTIAETDARIAGSTASRLEERFKPLSGRHLHISYAEVEELKRCRKELERKLEKLEQLREMQVKVYETAKRNREMLTDMREDKWNAYESDATRREQK